MLSFFSPRRRRDLDLGYPAFPPGPSEPTTFIMTRLAHGSIILGMAEPLAPTWRFPAIASGRRLPGQRCRRHGNRRNNGGTVSGYVRISAGAGACERKHRLAPELRRTRHRGQERRWRGWDISRCRKTRRPFTTICCRSWTPSPPAPDHQPPMAQNLPDGAGNRPAPLGLVTAKPSMELIRPPARIALAQIDDRLDRGGANPMARPLRRPAPVRQPPKSERLVALQPFVANPPAHPITPAGLRKAVRRTQNLVHELDPFLDNTAPIPRQGVLLATTAKLLPMSSVYSVTYVSGSDLPTPWPDRPYPSRGKEQDRELRNRDTGKRAGNRAHQRTFKAP